MAGSGLKTFFKDILLPPPPPSQSTGHLQGKKHFPIKVIQTIKWKHWHEVVFMSQLRSSKQSEPSWRNLINLLVFTNSAAAFLSETQRLKQVKTKRFIGFVSVTTE